MHFSTLKPGPKSRHHACLATIATFCLLVCASAQAPVAKAVGTVKSVSGNSLTLTTDSGPEQTVTLADSARIVRTAPGQTDLKNATAIVVSDIQIGDRILARGQAGEGNAVIASSAIVMSKGDLAQKQQRERDEWRRGVGGIVKSVDSGAGVITISNSLVASGKPIAIHVSADSQIHRYSPESVKFDDAKPGTVDQIKPGDQLRARGTKNADGTEFNAQAIVSGTFRDVAGTVVSSDAANGSVTIMDLATKKPVTVKIGPDSQLHKLPQMVAMGIAMRLKGGTAGPAPGPAQGPPGIESKPAPGGGNWAGGQGGAQGSGAAGATGSAGAGGPGGNWRGAGGGPPDFQQMLSRMPAVSLADLQKGDAVMLVATEGGPSGGPIAITLLAGVEPILSAAPAGTSAASILSPWNLGAPAGAGGDVASQ